jgi:hypothetical protein
MLGVPSMEGLGRVSAQMLPGALAGPTSCTRIMGLRESTRKGCRRLDAVSVVLLIVL